MSSTVCVFEGDDAAPEAVRSTVHVLESLDVDLDFVMPPVDEYADELTNGGVPPAIREPIEEADTVLFGAASHLHTPILRYLRWEYGGSGTSANVRPIRYIDGAMSPLDDPADVDYLIVRENLEGMYFRGEGELAELADSMPSLSGAGGRRVDELGDGKFAIRVATEDHLDRFASIASSLAAERATDDSVLVTCATKSNVLEETDGLFDRAVESAVREHAELEYEHLHVDDVAQRLVTDPSRFDVVVTTNYAGDILSDLGAGTVGGLGVAPSGCYGDGVAYFEPVHGTAPDIAGEDAINPTAMLLSAVMMLEYLGDDNAAARLSTAVEAAYGETSIRTRDMGGEASTSEFTDTVIDRL